MEKPDPALKGKQNGNCNREACQKPGAVFFNRSTHMFYCEACARLINKFPPTRADCMRDFGSPDLCVKVETK